MSPHPYVPPMFPGRPIPRGCRHGEPEGDAWVRCERPEDDPIHTEAEEAAA